MPAHSKESRLYGLQLKDEPLLSDQMHFFVLFFSLYTVVWPNKEKGAIWWIIYIRKARTSQRLHSIIDFTIIFLNFFFLSLTISCLVVPFRFALPSMIERRISSVGWKRKKRGAHAQRVMPMAWHSQRKGKYGSATNPKERPANGRIIKAKGDLRSMQEELMTYLSFGYGKAQVEKKMPPLDFVIS